MADQNENVLLRVKIMMDCKQIYIFLHGWHVCRVYLIKTISFLFSKTIDFSYHCEPTDDDQDNGKDFLKQLAEDLKKCWKRILITFVVAFGRYFLW
jgi:hypothetical protein